MYDNDYIVLMDENGTPYLAHAYATDGKGSNRMAGIRNAFKGFAPWGSKTGNTHKYKEKIPLGNGKFRYVYEQAKKAAKKAWGSKAGRWIDEHDAGLSERLMSGVYGRKKRRAQKSGDRDAASYYSKRQQALKYEGRREGKAAKDAVRGAKEAAIDRVKDRLGYDEREAYENALRLYRNESRQGKPKTEAQREGHWQSGRRLDAAKEAYDNTILGRYDKLSKRVKNATNRNRRRQGKR